MTEPIDRERLEQAYLKARAALLAERTLAGHWTGELSTSALSTATAVSALALACPDDAKMRGLIEGGVAWLAHHQNDDGGWGDTTRSFSNISTSMLIKAAFHITRSLDRHPKAYARLEEFLRKHCGDTPAQQAEAIRARYGKDRTFAVPILMNCALAGFVSWNEVLSLPFELACFPQSWFRFFRLPVVSYALPALIAVGLVIFEHKRPWFPLNIIRKLAIKRSLSVLEKIQPSSGGFLEATPLTSFVTMSLAASGRADHPVVKKAVEFIVASVRPDGSWPIDSNLATWVTTLSVNALAAADDLDALDNKEAIRDWLLKQQYKERHPYTGADPGGWAWTDLPGGVPDADDTPGALLALQRLGDPRKLANGVPDWIPHPIARGLQWLTDLQNRDGGFPTFCRGWGALPFDRSGSDLTAHALRAVGRWKEWWILVLEDEDYDPLAAPDLDAIRKKLTGRIDADMSRGFAYLARTQHPDGSWLPLWFGNQHCPDDENPTYGTSRVLAAYRDLEMVNAEPARKGIAWLLANQNEDGGWGGGKGSPSSVEETSLALDVLIPPDDNRQSAVNRGLHWLVEQVEAGGLGNPAPIGFYFAKLWYFEKLYPIVFSVAALGRARRAVAK